jgi:hypothetical protein
MRHRLLGKEVQQEQRLMRKSEAEDQKLYQKLDMLKAAEEDDIANGRKKAHMLQPRLVYAEE